MTEKHTIIGKCGKKITVKIWKNGGSVKCPDQTTNTYPKPSQLRINQIISDACLSCTSLASDSVRTCPKCNGSGQVEDTGNHLAFTKTCELCDGAGKIPTNSDTKRTEEFCPEYPDECDGQDLECKRKDCPWYAEKEPPL